MIHFAFPGRVRNLRVWLFHENGLWLDQYYESEYGASWGPSIYNVPRSLNDDAYAAVQHALNSGETESVEFKAWVDPSPGSNKAVELSRTVVAFANRGGGEIFIGIDDDAEIKDISRHLRPLYGERCGGDHDCMVAAYVSDAQKIITEDVTPQPHVVLEPVVVAEQQLLRLRVSRGDEGPYSLVRSGAILLRRGATNKPISAADLAEVIRASRGTMP